MFNKSIIMGNLARDPENKKVGENQVTRLVVAVNDVVKKDKAHYIDVETWNKTAENCCKISCQGSSSSSRRSLIPRHLGKGWQEKL